MATTLRRLQARDLLALRLAGDVQIAGDGGAVAFTETASNAEKNEYTSRIWLARPGGGPVPLTAGPRDSTPRWSPDGRYLAFLRRSEEGATQIWLLPTNGGEARQLTRIKGGCSHPVWSPDGRCLAFVARVRGGELQPDGREEEEKDPFVRYNKDVRVITRLFYKLDTAGFFDERRAQIGLIAVADPDAAPVFPVANGTAYTAGPAAAALPVLLTGGEFDHADPAFSPDGSLVAFTAHRCAEADWEPDVRDLWVVPAAGGEPLRLTRGDLLCSTPAFSPDGRTIAFIASRAADHGYGNDRIYLVDRDGGAAARCLTAGSDLTFDDISSKDTPAPASSPLTWSPEGRTLYALASDHGTVHVHRVDVATGAVSRATDGDRCVYSYHICGERIALAVADYLDPARVCLAAWDGKAAGDEQTLTDANPWLREVALSRPERYQFRGPEQVGSSEPGPAVDGWIMRPPGHEPGQRCPAILQIHGGPMAMYGARFFFEFQELCARGYVVLFTNPRGSLGYGEQFCACIKADWGNRDYADCMAGVDAALARFDCIDPRRLGVMGGSYGGFLVNWIAGHTDRFACAVTMRSVVNRMSAMGTSDVGFSRVPLFGGAYWWEDPAPYLKQSPLLHASRIHTPLLIEHQENDLRCPIDQAEQLYAALKLQKKEVKFVRYPGESHEMSRAGKPWHRVYRLVTNGDWLDQHLQP